MGYFNFKRNWAFYLVIGFFSSIMGFFVFFVTTRDFPHPYLGIAVGTIVCGVIGRILLKILKITFIR